MNSKNVLSCHSRGNLLFRKSSFSQHSKYCVGVLIDKSSVKIINTNDNNSSVIQFSLEEWKAFVKGVKNNEFDIYDHHAIRMKGTILIRETNLKYFPDGIFIPHPYRRWLEDSKDMSRRTAISLGRITFCKNVEMILEANRTLPEMYRVRMCGSVNRMYENFVLKKKFKGYSKYLPMSGGHVRQPWSAANLASRAVFNIDLTDFSKMGDGGGTSYSIMEAMDGGAVNILHRNWTEMPGEMKEGENCLAVSTAEELSELIKMYKLKYPRMLKWIRDIRQEGYRLLKRHSPKVIGSIYKELMK